MEVVHRKITMKKLNPVLSLVRSQPVLLASFAWVLSVGAPAFASSWQDYAVQEKREPAPISFEMEAFTSETREDSLGQRMKHLKKALQVCIELGEIEVAGQLEEVMIRMQLSAERATNTSRAIQDRSLRVDILRAAEGQLRRSGWEKREMVLTRFLRVSDSHSNNATDEEKLAVLKALGPVPEIFPKVVDTLRAASRLATQQRNFGLAKECLELAEFYVKRQGLGAQDPSSERAAPTNLRERKNRIAVIRLGAQVMREAGDMENSEFLRRIAQFGRLQDENASAAELSAAVQGLQVNELQQKIEAAASVAGDMGQAVRSRALQSLLEYYRDRDSGRLISLAKDVTPVRRLGTLAAPPAPFDTRLDELREAQEQLKRLRARLEVMTRRLEALQR